MHPFTRYRMSQDPPMLKKALGKLLGYSDPAITLIEQRKRGMSIESARRCAKAVQAGPAGHKFTFYDLIPAE